MNLSSTFFFGDVFKLGTLPKKVIILMMPKLFPG